MFIPINKNILFKLLQSEKYKIGKNLIKTIKSVVEKNSNRSLNDFSKERLSQFYSEFVSLKNKWKRLHGGKDRSCLLYTSPSPRD